MDLTEFLLARIAEDEAVARVEGAGAMVGSHWKRYPREAYEEIQSATLAWARRVLAECEAKRRLIDSIYETAAMVDNEWGCLHEPSEIRHRRCMWRGEWKPVPDDCVGVTAALTDLEILAAIYADHPDYRQEWAP